MIEITLKICGTLLCCIGILGIILTFKSMFKKSNIKNLIFRAKYLDNHKEFKEGYYEFKATDWDEAVCIASKCCYKNITDGLKSLDLIGKTNTFEQDVYF